MPTLRSSPVRALCWARGIGASVARRPVCRQKFPGIPGLLSESSTNNGGTQHLSGDKVDPGALARFEDTVLPRLGAAYTLARQHHRQLEREARCSRNGMAGLSHQSKVTGYADQGMRRPSIGVVWVPSSRVTVQNLELGPFDQLQ